MIFFREKTFPVLGEQVARRTLTPLITVRGAAGPFVVELRKPDFTVAAVFQNSEPQTFAAAEVQGPHVIVGRSGDAVTARQVSITADQVLYLDIDDGQRPAPGPGFLAGSFPTGITMVEGSPVSATIRVHWRRAGQAPGDGVLVAQVQSAQDGTWRVDNVDPALRFDVICRYDGYNDMILSDISPIPY